MRRRKFRPRIDCSGLIVNVYREAVIGTPYRLPFVDAAVINFYNSYTVEIDSPQIGDLIFMGEDDISHMAILEKRVDGTIYFIDAYLDSSPAGSSPHARTQVRKKGCSKKYVHPCIRT